MSKTFIVVITGAPATGKTTLGKDLSQKFKLPFISKDALKDRIFDNLGWNDKAWSLKVSAASHRIMDYFIEEELKVGHSLILESNFKRHIDSERFRHIQSEYNCELLQVLCWAKGEIVFERFAANRANSSERHAGHAEAISLEEIRQGFIESNGRDEPLEIDGATIELDTTDFRSADYAAVYQAVQKLLA